MEDARKVQTAGSDYYQSVRLDRALFRAISLKDISLAERLLASGADANARTGSDWTPLHVAASTGVPGVVAPLVAAGASVKARSGERSRTPLHVAVIKGHADVVQSLIAAGAEVDAGDNEGWTPLMASILFIQRDVAADLMAAGAEVDAKTINAGEAATPWYRTTQLC